MLATQCYESHSPCACPLTIWTKSAWQDQHASFSAVERECLLAQAFRGELGEQGMLFDKEGKMCHVFLGGGENASDAEAIASGVLTLPAGCFVPQQPLSQAAYVAWSLAQYRFDRYKTSEVMLRTLIVPSVDSAAVLAEAQAVFLVRDLINTPTNDMGPPQLAAVVSQLALEQGGEFKEWVGEELVRDNFPAIYAVGRAGSVAPRLLSLTWGEATHPRVTLVGKGVCFDSGGLDIKPASGMRLMKKDMGGAAQVIGLAQWIMTHQLPIRLQVLIPAVENAIDAMAYRPGDVLTMRNGLTVEIHNTDAEGRLVLADALVKAAEDKPELLIDFATLTGAARVAVGTDLAALFSNDDTLADALATSAEEAADPLWRLPLHAGYAALFESTVADLSNASESPYGGAITAALFLQRFVPASLPWAHFDVMAWNVSTRPGKPEGGEAMGMLAVGYYLQKRYA